VFAFGGAFLSLEVFELPWMLMAMGGIMPHVIHREIRSMELLTTEKRRAYDDDGPLPEPQLNTKIRHTPSPRRTRARKVAGAPTLSPA